jgi:transcription elongation factor GreA
MSRIPISVEGYKRLEKELEALKKERPAVIQAIKEAREEGDLRENAGYDAARERQGLLEAKIAQLESRMVRFEVIDIDQIHSDRVVFGATVELEDLDTGEIKVYTLLGPDEADSSTGSISIESPVGRALLGKREGDEVSIIVPKGTVNYEIRSIRFLGSAGLRAS